MLANGTEVARRDVDATSRQHRCGGQWGGRAAAAAAAWRRQRQRGNDVGSAVVLPPRATAVATKTPAVTAMAGAQTITNNKLKMAAVMATETAMMTAATMTMKMKAPVASAAAAAVW